jgi:anthranilate synthase component 1
MYSVNEQAYIALSAEHDLIPVYLEVLVDDETPLSVLRRFADRENTFLLESLAGGETWGRYSFIGVDCEPYLDVDHARGPTGELERLREIYRDLRVAQVPDVPRFFGGVVGYIAYEGVAEMERLPDPKPSRTVEPRSRFMRVDQLIVFDGVRHTCKIIVCSRPGDAASPAQAYRQALADIAAIQTTLQEPGATAEARAYPAVTFESNMTEEVYKDIVARTKEYIRNGDIIQAVLSQRFSAQTEIPPLQLYRALRLLNPAPYTFFLKMGDRALVGSSPEVMVRLTDDLIELRPIAGTKPRGATPDEDRALEKALLDDEKEQAEHVMLVDLGRNDLGRVAVAGSVNVTEYMTVERYSHVMHIVSHVVGTLKKGCDAFDVLTATFPAGTLSGAPKIRAMEIINELEPEPRGVYGGAVGYIGYDGNMDLAITIRTLKVSGGTVSVQAGAGIVYDSDPQREFEECQHKARGMQKAVELAARGLKL